MSLALLDWRRRVAALYAEVRATGDPEAAHARWRRTRDELFAHHPASPLPATDRARFRGLRYAPYDPGLRFVVAVDPDVAALRHEVPTDTDGIVAFQRIGQIHLADLGSLDVWWTLGYGGGVFLPVRDPNPATYGGGRYVLDTVKGADLGAVGADEAGSLLVDLNFAYNPSCAYDPAWTCPLAPLGNALDRPVAAGELTPSRHDRVDG